MQLPCLPTFISKCTFQVDEGRRTPRVLRKPFLGEKTRFFYKDQAGVTWRWVNSWQGPGLTGYYGRYRPDTSVDMILIH